MNRIFPVFCFIVLLWAGRYASAQHPVGYGALRAMSHTASFAIDSLDRAVIREKVAAYYASEPVTYSFDILVEASGRVKYVRAPRLRPELSELRLACTSALYGFQFEPVDSASGDRWYKATMVPDQN